MGVSADLVHLTYAGYGGAALGMALESCGVPLPSELILPLTGYLVSQGRLSLLPALIAVTAGGTAGSLVAYLLGKYGGRSLVLRYGAKVGMRAREMERAERFFRRHGGWAVLLGRLLPVVRTFISFPAGFGAMPLGSFLVYTVLGAIPWNVALVYGGVVLGNHWQSVSRLGERVSALLVAGLVLAALVWWAVRRKGRPSES